jgi:hypothetical protein
MSLGVVDDADRDFLLLLWESIQGETGRQSEMPMLWTACRGS